MFTFRLNNTSCSLKFGKKYNWFCFRSIDFALNYFIVVWQNYYISVKIEFFVNAKMFLGKNRKIYAKCQMILREETSNSIAYNGKYIFFISINDIMI